MQAASKVSCISMSSDITQDISDAIKGLPLPLRGLVEKGMVAAQWALGLSSFDQLVFSEPICELVAADIIKPPDVLKLGYAVIRYRLEKHASIIRSLLVDWTVTVEKLIDHEESRRVRPDGSEVQKKLKSPEALQEMKKGISMSMKIISSVGARGDTTSSIKSSATTTLTAKGMGSDSSEKSHPFRVYKRGRIQSCGGKHYFRPYQNVLWVLDEQVPKNSASQVYSLEFGSVKEYAMSTSEIEEFRTLIAVAKTKAELRNTKLESIRKPLTGARKVDFSKNLARAIAQGEYTVVDSSSQQPIVGTCDAEPSLIMALYDSKNKIAVLAHVDASTDTDSLPRTLVGLSKEHTVAHLYGGNISSTDMCMNIIDFLENEKIKISNADIVLSDFHAASLAIDARTGQIYTPLTPGDFSEDPSRVGRSAFRALSTSSNRPLTKI